MTRTPTRNAALACSCALFLSAAVHADDRVGCPEIDPRAWAWRDYAQWFRENADCDDGESSSTLSWFVTHKLATDWSSLRTLAELVQKDAPLKRFFLRHIGNDASVRDLQRVRRNARLACPRDQTAFCREIAQLLKPEPLALELQLQMGDFWSGREAIKPGKRP